MNKSRNHIFKLINNEFEPFLVFATSSTCVPQFWLSVIKIKSNNTDPILLIHKLILYNITKVHPNQGKCCSLPKAVCENNGIAFSSLV